MAQGNGMIAYEVFFPRWPIGPASDPTSQRGPRYRIELPWPRRINGQAALSATESQRAEMHRIAREAGFLVVTVEERDARRVDTSTTTG